MKLTLALTAVAVIIAGHYGQENVRLKESLRICRENCTVIARAGVKHKTRRTDIMRKSLLRITSK